MEQNNSKLNKIIEDNMGLIYAQLHKTNTIHDSDAKSYALYGLYKAAKTYSEDHKAAFSTYASVCIYNGICGYLRKRQRVIDTITVSYDAPVGDGNCSLLDLLESHERADTNYMSYEGIQSIAKFIKRYYSNESNPMRRKILKIWIRSNFELSNKDIAKLAGCSASYVSRVLIIFRERLKEYLKGVC